MYKFKSNLTRKEGGLCKFLIFLNIGGKGSLNSGMCTRRMCNFTLGWSLLGEGVSCTGLTTPRHEIYIVWFTLVSHMLHTLVHAGGFGQTWSDIRWGNRSTQKLTWSKNQPWHIYKKFIRFRWTPKESGFFLQDFLWQRTTNITMMIFGGGCTLITC